MHPDKNSAEDADVQFRNLVSVYEVLKDPSKREKYNSVLKNGLPNWKSAIYYYRKARKVGLMEGAILLFVIITITQVNCLEYIESRIFSKHKFYLPYQYIVGWAVYLEKKYTMVKIALLNILQLYKTLNNFRLNYLNRKRRK